MDRANGASHIMSKVPAVTLGFWIIKILATTLGETGGDTVTMTWLGETTTHPVPERISDRHRHLRCRCSCCWSGRRSGRGVSIHGSTGQRSSLRRPAERRWQTSPTVRSASVIPADRSCSSPACSLSLFAWYRALGTVDVNTGYEPARRDLLLDHDHLLADAGHRARRLDRGRSASASAGAPLVFGAALAVVAILYFTTSVSHVGLFWAAFILTRPLGATVGDFLDKPVARVDWK